MSHSSAAAYVPPCSDLMSRVPITPFAALDAAERTELLRGIRALRATANEEAKSRGKMTRSAQRNRAKRGTKAKPVMSEAKLQEALAALPPEQLAALKAIYS